MTIRAEDLLPETLAAARFRLTDYGNAERLVNRHGHEIRHVPGRGWHAWDGTRWKWDDTGELMRRAKETVRSIYHEAAVCEDDEERKRIAQWGRVSESGTRLEAMVKLAASELPVVVPPRLLDADPFLLTVVNGTIDLRTGALLDHDPAHLITRLATVEYDPDARSDLWELFLATITGGDEDLAAFLQRAVGYTLTGDTSEDKLLFPHGPSATGKSSFLEAVKAMLGEYAMTADFETFLKRRGDGGIRNDIARLDGARMVISVEVDEGKRLAEGLVKTITGGDTVAARFLHHEYFEFVPRFKLWLSANTRPSVKAADAAMWRRIVQVPFLHVIPEQDRDPAVKWRLRGDSEMRSAVLAWAVRGCLVWQGCGLVIPDSVRDYTAEYRRENDALAEWLEDECRLGPDLWTLAKDLRRNYERWCEQSGTEPIGAGKTWGNALRDHGCKQDKRHAGHGWAGIGVTP